jgi:hypothetical protein
MRVDFVAPYNYAHRSRLRREEDVDAELTAWIAEARQVDEQRHVCDPDWRRVREPPGWVRVRGLPREHRRGI